MATGRSYWMAGAAVAAGVAIFAVLSLQAPERGRKDNLPPREGELAAREEGERNLGAPVPLPGGRTAGAAERSGEREGAESGSEARVAGEDLRERRDAVERRGAEVLDGTRTVGGSGDAGSETTAQVRDAEPSDEPTAFEDLAEQADLRERAAQVAEELALLDENEIEGRTDRALTDDDASDAEREEAREAVLADAAIVEWLVRQKLGPDASEAQLRDVRGRMHTLLSGPDGDRLRGQYMAEAAALAP